MKQQDTAALLSWMQGLDGRHLTDISVAAWTEVLGSDITYTEARTAPVEHYATETRYCMPADVIRVVDERRRGERRSAEHEQYMLEAKQRWCNAAGVTIEEYDQHLAAGDHTWIREHDEKQRALQS